MSQRHTRGGRDFSGEKWKKLHNYILSSYCGFKYVFYFNPYLGKMSSLTNIVQIGWNHQPAFDNWKSLELHTCSEIGRVSGEE